MLAIKKARKLIEAQPNDPTARTLAELVHALESDTPFALGKLYQMDYKRFELALAIMAEWRLDRYYASKLRLMDATWQVVSGGTSPSTSAATTAAPESVAATPSAKAAATAAPTNGAKGKTNA